MSKSSNKGDRRDQYSSFRRHIIRAKESARRKGIEFDLTVAQLKKIWDRQNGKCVYSGVKLSQFQTTEIRKETYRPHFASLDRKDSNKGYTSDNVQFISMIAQFAKNNFSEEDLFLFCKDVVKHNEQGIIEE